MRRFGEFLAAVQAPSSPAPRVLGCGGQCYDDVGCFLLGGRGGCCGDIECLLLHGHGGLGYYDIECFLLDGRGGLCYDDIECFLLNGRGLRGRRGGGRWVGLRTGVPPGVCPTWRESGPVQGGVGAAAGPVGSTFGFRGADLYEAVPPEAKSTRVFSNLFSNSFSNLFSKVLSSLSFRH